LLVLMTILRIFWMTQASPLPDSSSPCAFLENLSHVVTDPSNHADIGQVLQIITAFLLPGKHFVTLFSARFDNKRSRYS
jgi:hypothetical protein